MIEDELDFRFNGNAFSAYAFGRIPTQIFGKGLEKDGSSFLDHSIQEFELLDTPFVRMVDAALVRGKQWCLELVYIDCHD
jgi:hypothetical protein